MTLHQTDSHWRAIEETRPLKSGQLARDIADGLRASRERSLEIEYADDLGLLADQTIDPTNPVTLLIRGAAGRLADDGLLALGARELHNLLGANNPVRYVLCDLFPTDSEKARNFIARQRAAGNYQLHPTRPYICSGELTTDVSRSLGINALIAATPPNVHSQDALLAWELGIHAFIEKPAYPPAIGGTAQGVIRSSLSTGRIDLIDCFLGNRAICDFLGDPMHFLSGHFTRMPSSLGAIQFIHATCLEPHSANEEGSRANRLMDYETQGGFLYADMAPHPLAVTEALLQKVLGLSLATSRIIGTYRTREDSVEGPDDAETGAAVLRALDNTNDHPLLGPSGIELLSVAGKGLRVPGGQRGEPMPNYMVTIGCEGGRIDICLGNAQKTIPSYICVTPKDPFYTPRMRVYKNSGLGYSSLLADCVIHAQYKANNNPKAGETTTSGPLSRIQAQSNASLVAAHAIQQVYEMWGRSANGIQIYGQTCPLTEPVLPAVIPLACRIHPQLAEDTTRGVQHEVLRRTD